MPIDFDKSILLVDDMPTIRKVLLSILMQMGHENFFEAKDGQEALEILKQNHEEIDLIIADWNMPNMSGIELWRSMKDVSTYKHIKFIMITSENERNHIVSALKEGVHNYILKPFDPMTVKARIEKL